MYKHEMSKKNPSVIKIGKDGQFYHQSGSSMGSMSAAAAQAHKNLQAGARKQTEAITVHRGGGFVIGKTQPGGSPTNSSAQFQKHALKASAQVAGHKASPAELKAAKPGSGLAFGKTVTVLKGGRRKRTKMRRHKKSKTKKSSRKSTKRFRKGGQPWGCYSGGKRTKHKRHSRRRSKKH